MVRNGEISPSAEITPEKNSRKRNHSKEGVIDSLYRRRWLAQMETLVSYFGEEWFDFDYMIEFETTGKKSGISAPPVRCPSCSKPWSPIGKSADCEYYDVSMFINIPLEKSICPKCVRPVAVG